MTALRYPARILVFSGTFVSQPLAFARLLDAVDRVGAFLDLGEVDVIRHATEVRLAHYFPPAVVATLMELQGEDDTLILIKPRPGHRSAELPIRDPMLKRLGHFQGEVLRADLSDRV